MSRVLSPIRALTLATAALTLATPAAHAAPTFEYHITGSYLIPDNADYQLDYSSYLIGATTFRANGSQDIYGSPFDIHRTEVFSDPDITPSPTDYYALRTYGYFGLYSDVTPGNATPRLPFVAALPGTAAAANADAASSGAPGASAFSILFASYLSTHANIDTPAKLVQLLIDGPDVPEPGANIDWIDFNDFIAGSDPFLGNVATTFQTGQTLELITFDSTGLATVIGTISTEAAFIPEPAAVSLAALATLPLATRRRRTSGRD